MKNNVKLLTQNCCDNLLSFPSRDDLRQRYNNKTFGENDLEYLKQKSTYSIETHFPLGIAPKDDCKSSIEIFNQLINLNKVQANDKRFWVSLTHTIFFEYTVNRWGIDSTTSNDTIVSRFHFEGSGLEARMRNAISRLWWAAKITYDNSRDNKFELTDLLWEKQDIYQAIVERSFATYPNLVHGFLEFYKVNKLLKEDELRAILRGLNAIGGVKILPSLTKQEVVDEIKRIADFSKIEVIY